MAVTRGTFLKSLGKSLPGMLLGSAAAVTAQKLLTKVVAATGEVMQPAAENVLTKQNETQSVAPADMILSGPPEGNRVALTFDDGPTPGVTDRILDELKRRGLHATFFMIGQNIAAAPDLARRVVAEGHTVANHTLTHPKLTDLSDARAAEEIQKTQDIFAELLGVRPTFFRAPFGLLRQDQAHLVHARGMRIVRGNVDPRDWAQPGEDKITETILRDSRAGAIIICHDKYAQTSNATGAILDGLLACNFAPVKMAELLSD